jgi:hypothetical protein
LLIVNEKKEVNKVKAVAVKSGVNDTLTRNRQGTNHKQVPVKKSVPTFSGSIPLIQLKSLCPCDGGCPRCTGVIQAKLKIGEPNDKYEQEADRIADQIMRMPEPGYPEYFEDENERIQAKQIQAQTLAVPANIETGISALKGGGQPLPESARAFFEPRFGRDFQDVRVHTGAKAADAANAVNAKAFTTGNDLVFGADQYSPHTTEGKRLLAHELMHVVQQKESQTIPAGALRDIIFRFHHFYEQAIMEPDMDIGGIYTRSAIQTHGHYTMISPVPAWGVNIFRFRFRFNFRPDPTRVHVRVRQSGVYSSLPSFLQPPPPQPISQSSLIFSGQDLVFVLNIPVGSEWSIQLDDPPPLHGRHKIISLGERV